MECAFVFPYLITTLFNMVVKYDILGRKIGSHYVCLPSAQSSDCHSHLRASRADLFGCRWLTLLLSSPSVFCPQCLPVLGTRQAAQRRPSSNHPRSMHQATRKRTLSSTSTRIQHILRATYEWKSLSDNITATSWRKPRARRRRSTKGRVEKMGWRGGWKRIHVALTISLLETMEETEVALTKPGL